MKHSLLFIPDISGFTQFIQSTEAAHSQHVIAELLELLIESNISELELAEIEGDALFFFKEEDTLSQEKLLAQIEHMFTAFYSHLKMLEQNRICPCNACASAPRLELKIVIHCGELQFIEVQGNRKPFGQTVIEAHRMLKNSIESDNYAMISSDLADGIRLTHDYKSMFYAFKEGKDTYDGKEMEYVFSVIDPGNLKIMPVQEAIPMNFDRGPDFTFNKAFEVSAERVFETLSSFRERQEWTPGAVRYEFNDNEVTRKGTKHVCVIDGQRLDFITVSAEGTPGQLVYGELTTTPPPVDELVQLNFIDSTGETSSKMRTEVYITAKSPFKKMLLALGLKKVLKKNFTKGLNALEDYLALKN
jgi:hypothetical protein